MDFYHFLNEYVSKHFDFRLDIVVDYFPLFLRGALSTIIMSIVGTIFGTIIGLFISLGRMFALRQIRFIFVWYINFFRGTPLLVQIFIVHFGVMHYFMSPVNALYSAIVALALNHSAYIAEIFRAGIQSVDSGQSEAARSLGMNQYQSMRHIIIPQAFKAIVPALGNEFIALLKDSSLAAVIAAPELVYWAKASAAQYFRVWEPYLTIAFIYLLLTLSLSRLVSYMERRLNTQ